jgi:hypothetical protein
MAAGATAVRDRQLRRITGIRRWHITRTVAIGYDVAQVRDGRIALLYTLQNGFTDREQQNCSAMSSAGGRDGGLEVAAVAVLVADQQLRRTAGRRGPSCGDTFSRSSVLTYGAVARVFISIVTTRS